MSDIFGDWIHEGAALNADGSELYAWSAQVGIAPDGDGARITTAAGRSQSRSISTNALIGLHPDGRTTLLYDYIADPTHEGTASHYFFGMTRFVFDRDGNGADGNYLNYNGRYTFGRMRLRRA